MKILTIKKSTSSLSDYDLIDDNNKKVGEIICNKYDLTDSKIVVRTENFHTQYDFTND